MMSIIGRVKEFIINKVSNAEKPKPVNLDEAVKALDNYFNDDAKVFIFESKDSVDLLAIKLHMTVGMSIRNDWGLWHGSPLAHHMQNVHGIYHPDDMSGYILRDYIRSIKGE